MSQNRPLQDIEYILNYNSLPYKYYEFRKDLIRLFNLDGHEMTSMIYMDEQLEYPTIGTGEYVKSLLSQLVNSLRGGVWDRHETLT